MTTGPKEIDVTGTVLFLGSGFTNSATNIRGIEVPTGRGLREELAKILGVDAEAYDLRTLAEELGSRADQNLYDVLYELFTVGALLPHQE